MAERDRTMIRRSMVLWVVLASSFGAAMFLIKHEVQVREAWLGTLRQEILASQQSIQVLRAEWSYLNQPVRIEALIRRHMDLRPTETAQIGDIDTLPVHFNIAVARATVAQ
jgi:hypothetical protein